MGAVSYLATKGFSCALELGLQSWGKSRADVIGVNLKGKIVICEIKSCASDFDTDNKARKWHKYHPFSHIGYFVTPDYLLDKRVGSAMIEAVKEHGWGIMVLDSNTGLMRVAVRCKHRNMAPKFRRHILTRLAWRGGISKRNFKPVRVYLNVA